MLEVPPIQVTSDRRRGELLSLCPDDLSSSKFIPVVSTTKSLGLTTWGIRIGIPTGLLFVGTPYDVKVGKTGADQWDCWSTPRTISYPIQCLSRNTSRFGGYRIESRTIQTVH